MTTDTPNAKPETMVETQSLKEEQGSSVAESGGTASPKSDALVRHMVDQFLGWRLPDNFNPDGGIQFEADAAKKLDPRNLRYEPNGTNLFDATQATEMVRYMLEGWPTALLEEVEEIGPPTPLAALKFRMEQGGHTQTDLAKLLGSRSKAAEILSGKRSLSKAQIATLSDAWGIPARSLLGPAICPAKTDASSPSEASTAAPAPDDQ